jgi:hypothetical protein
LFEREGSGYRPGPSRKAVWLAAKVKETLGLSAIKLALKVDAEWLCYANAVRLPSMTNCLCRFLSAYFTKSGQRFR